MNGWKGKILKIDLTDKNYSILRIEQSIYKEFLGGKGIAGYFLRPHIKENWDSPEMPILFFTGPIVDTIIPTSGRMTIMSKSPLTGTIGDTSVGGKLAVQIKRAGYDGIIVTGKSKSYCGIDIKNSEINFANAENLKGKDIHELKDHVNTDGSIAAIGSAAENGVLFANIAIDEHYFSGRSGLGLTMASKNLKYITVSGDEKTEIADKDETKDAREEILRLVSASPMLKGELGISEYGTGALYDLMHSRRMMPTDNFKKTYFPKASESNAWQYKEKYKTKKTGCAGCHIQCKKKSHDNKIMPEFETMSHFTALMGNNDIDIVVEANRICNETGMDTISAAVTISCYAEISGEKLSGAKILSLLKNIAASENEGSELKLGSYRYAQSKNRPETSISVKKMELSAYDPRGAYGMALAYATSTRGGCHLRAYPIAHEILRKPVATDRFSFSGKARIIKINEDINAVIDSLTACKFIFFGASLEEYAKALSGITGEKYSAQDLIKIGERIYYNERIMNSLCGFDVNDDDLPEIFFTTEGSSGDGITVPAIDRSEFLKTRANYYKIRGLDSQGNPTQEKMEELNLQ